MLVNIHSLKNTTYLNKPTEIYINIHHFMHTDLKPRPHTGSPLRPADNEIYEMEPQPTTPMPEFLTTPATTVRETPVDLTVKTTDTSFEEREAFYKKLQEEFQTITEDLDNHFPTREPATEKLNAAYIGLTSVIYATLNKFGKIPELSEELHTEHKEKIKKFDSFVKTLKSNRWFKYLAFAAGTITILGILLKMMPFNVLPNIFSNVGSMVSAISKPNMNATDNLATAKEIIKESPVAEIASGSTIVMGIGLTVVVTGLLFTNLKTLNLLGKVYKAYHRI